MRPALEQARARSSRRERITLHGFVDHTDVPAVLAHLDVLVLPSVYEELGSVMVEAMASGVPVVATRVGGIPELVRDGETGLLVDGRCDVDELARAIDRLLEDHDLRARLGAAARDRAREYSWPALAERITALYSAACDESGTGRSGSAPGERGEHPSAGQAA
jgi:glycosyltransferase involved in cell wall biosynthesis